jgi:hypothetical protein
MADKESVPHNLAVLFQGRLCLVQEKCCYSLMLSVNASFTIGKTLNTKLTYFVGLLAEPVAQFHRPRGHLCMGQSFLCHFVFLPFFGFPFDHADSPSFACLNRKGLLVEAIHVPLHGTIDGSR